MDNSTELISKKSEIIKNENQEISICEIMKNNTSEIIEKLEAEIPVLFQNYSDLYSRYLHSIQDVFGVCYLAEKQYFDKVNVNQEILKTFNDHWKFLTYFATSQIGFSTDFLKSYVQFRTSIVDSWDRYAHTAINAYAKMLFGIVQK